MIKNLQQALGPLRALQQGVLEAKKKAEKTVADNIALTAKSRATGHIAGLIGVSETDKGTSVYVGQDGPESELAAYIEFGTGTVNVEDTILSVAAKYGIQDTGAIDEAFKFIKTKLGHGKSQPFFFPAIYEHQDELIPEIDNELQKLAH